MKSILTDFQTIKFKDIAIKKPAGQIDPHPVGLGKYLSSPGYGD